MWTFEQTMAHGQAQYAEVIHALTTLGLPMAFTQTGGMCAALEVSLEAGHVLLVTHSDEPLSWDREDHKGWGVGLYADADAYGEGPLRYATTDHGDLQALVECVDQVLHHHERTRGQQQ